MEKYFVFFKENRRYLFAFIIMWIIFSILLTCFYKSFSISQNDINDYRNQVKYLHQIVENLNVEDKTLTCSNSNIKYFCSEKECKLYLKDSKEFIGKFEFESGEYRYINYFPSFLIIICNIIISLFIALSICVNFKCKKNN